MKALVSVFLLAATALGSADYAALLKRVVKKDGVDYVWLQKERAALDGFVRSLETAEPGEVAADRLAFWINAYNALTLQHVLDSAPKSSVREIDGFATQRKWAVAGRRLSLDDIENDILRDEFDDPRVHFVIHRAARGSPALAAEPYVGDTLDYALTQAGRIFLGDKEQNRFNDARLEAELSEIFYRFKTEFTADVKARVPNIPTLQLFLARYVPKESLARRLRGSRWQIRYRKFDWSLNRTGKQPAAEKVRGGSAIVWIYLVPAAAALLFGLRSLRAVFARSQGRSRRSDPDTAS